MSTQDSYTALMCSLPRSERLFVDRLPPLSRLRLNKRLRALSPEDARILHLLEHVLSWQEYDIEITEAQAVDRAKQALPLIPHSTLRRLFLDRMELRSAVAALRLRHRGDPAPTTPFGFGRWTRHIPAHWSEPTFGLDAPLPWLNEARHLLEQNDPLGLERHLLDTSHRQLKRYGARHHFDFEAVAIYVLTWNIFDRWAHSNAEAAAERFEVLAQQAMAAFGDINLEGTHP